MPGAFFGALSQPNPAIPFSDTAPSPETKTPGAGSMQMASRGDHSHPRLTSAQVSTLDNTGAATVMFTRTFTAEPAISIIAVENDTRSPPDFKVKQFLDDTGAPWVSGKPYGGAVVFATRARALPVVTAVLTEILKLSGYVPTEPAGGVKFSIIALQAS